MSQQYHCFSLFAFFCFLSVEINDDRMHVLTKTCARGDANDFILNDDETGFEFESEFKFKFLYESCHSLLQNGFAINDVDRGEIAD